MVHAVVYLYDDFSSTGAHVESMHRTQDGAWTRCEQMANAEGATDRWGRQLTCVGLVAAPPNVPYGLDPAYAVISYALED